MIYPLQSAIRESISSHRHQDDTLFLLLSTKLAWPQPPNMAKLVCLSCLTIRHYLPCSKIINNSYVNSQQLIWNRKPTGKLTLWSAEGELVTAGVGDSLSATIASWLSPTSTLSSQPSSTLSHSQWMAWTCDILQQHTAMSSSVTWNFPQLSSTFPCCHEFQPQLKLTNTFVTVLCHHITFITFVF